MSDLLDLARLRDWLAETLPGRADVQTAEKTAGGQSNPTFILTGPSGRMVLRRKPPGALLKSAHAIDREYRVMRALAGSDVPVPGMIAYCPDPNVIGAEFFLMEHVTGRAEHDPRCPDLDIDLRTRLFDRMNATLAALHKIDLAATGLEDFGKPGDYFARQLSRWTGQYRATQTEEIDPLEDLIDWLDTAPRPRPHPPCLVHGDWRLDNLLFDPATGEIRAVLDWELATLGHPLADLGGQLMQWAMPTGSEGRGLDGVDRAALGIPQDAAYVATYSRRMGWAEVPDMTYPVAFSFFRMAAILQGVKKRALDGNASNPEAGLRMGRLIPLFAERALARISAAA